ncbi:FtsX-like permease family protein [Candidatus Falkowbacteria bacterium]|nr:FtsX-like permease family protein [Candidatus Falkowbacteria bacterium]
MKIGAVVKLSLKSLIANKMRTLLTVLGMVIGIAAVIIVFSAGEGIKSLILGQVEAFGTDIIQTEPRLPSNKSTASKDAQSGQAIAQGVQLTSLKLSDMDDIGRLSNIKGSYATLTGQALASYEGETKKAIIFGVSAYFINIGSFELSEGRFYSDEEERSLSQVAVLGSKMKETLFGDSEAVGKMVRLKKEKYLVVGVMKERGATGFISFDDFIYVPARTMQKRILGIDHVVSVTSQLRDVSLAEDTAEDIRQILRENHQIENPTKDDFRVATMAELMDTLGTITGAITLLLLAIVGISLVVGGVGITNIMYVIVTERTSEIGLRKAVGATYRDVMLQFLIEAVLITLLGGVIGMIVGIFVSFGIATVASSLLGLSWKFIMPMKGFIVATIFSVFFGIIFGVYPARKAARLDPIEALRSE